MEFRPRRALQALSGGDVRFVVAGMRGSLRRLISVDDLIAMKRAAGRPKDLETAAELEALKALEGGA
jgi:hypothetical protein